MKTTLSILHAVYGIVILLAFVLSIFIVFPFVFVLGLIKLMPIKTIKHNVSFLIDAIATIWMQGNLLVSKALLPTQYIITGEQKFKSNGRYLIICNHQSWVDIVALQYVFSGKITYPKFFLKSQLVWVPFLGFAWWAQDFLFMKRYSKKYLKKHPSRKGKDIAITKKSMSKI